MSQPVSSPVAPAPFGLIPVSSAAPLARGTRVRALRPMRLTGPARRVDVLAGADVVVRRAVGADRVLVEAHGATALVRRSWLLAL